jgi:hypothetical protein
LASTSGLVLEREAGMGLIVARPPGALLYEWKGIVQRVIVAVWFSCTIVLAQRLRRIS